MTKQLKTLLILLIVTQAIFCKDQQYCSNEGLRNNDCEWYKDCLEPEYNCGAKGYPVGYGYKYCTRFVEQYDKFSPSAKKWIDGTLTCLKTSLKEQLEHPDKFTCANVKKIAFDSHPKCYTDNGFCELFTKSDITQVYQTLLSLMSVYQFTDFLNLQSISQVLSVAKTCLLSKI